MSERRSEREREREKKKAIMKEHEEESQIISE